MLSLVECRRLLGPSELRDEEVLELREHLYDLAGVVVDEIKERAAPSAVESPQSA